MPLLRCRIESHGANIDHGRRESVGGKQAAELPRSFFVGAMRDADEEVGSSLADVAAVESAGGCDLVNRRSRSAGSFPERQRLLPAARRRPDERESLTGWSGRPYLRQTSSQDAGGRQAAGSVRGRSFPAPGSRLRAAAAPAANPARRASTRSGPRQSCHPVCGRSRVETFQSPCLDRSQRSHACGSATSGDRLPPQNSTTTVLPSYRCSFLEERRQRHARGALDRPVLRSRAHFMASSIASSDTRTPRCIALRANSNVIEPGSTPPAVLSDNV